MSLLRRRMMMQNVGSTPLHPELEHYSAGDLLLTIQYRWTRKFVKYNDGFCISGSYKTAGSGDSTNIVVIGTNDESVLYGVTDSNGQLWGDVSPYISTVTYGGTDYRAVLSQYSMPGTPVPNFFSEKTYSLNEALQLMPVYDLLDYYYGVI